MRRALDRFAGEEQPFVEVRLVQGRQLAASTATALVWRCVVTLAAEADAPDDGLAALVAWQLQHCAVDVVCRRYAIGGRRALETLLRRYLEDRLIPSLGGG